MTHTRAHTQTSTDRHKLVYTTRTMPSTSPLLFVCGDGGDDDDDGCAQGSVDGERLRLLLLLLLLFEIVRLERGNPVLFKQCRAQTPDNRGGHSIFSITCAVFRGSARSRGTCSNHTARERTHVHVCCECRKSEIMPYTARASRIITFYNIKYTR
jgi:hypothetical protein